MPEFGTELAKASTCTEKWKKEKIMNKQIRIHPTKDISMIYQYHTQFSINK